MWTFSAPYPDYTDVIQIPSPELGDVESSLSEVKTKITMDGDVHTNISRRKRTYTWTFDVNANYAALFKTFFNLFAAEKIQVVTHTDEIRIGYFKINPLALNFKSRACEDYEAVTFTVEFETTE